MDNPLWQYSLSRYRRRGVEALCLRLQDDWGVDINLLLFAAWLGERGLQLGPGQLAALDKEVEPWRRTVALPLRTLRRQWRGQADIADLREGVKALELRAERALQERLSQLSLVQDFLPGGTVEANLRTLLAAAIRVDSEVVVIASELSRALLENPRCESPAGVAEVGSQ